MIASLIAAAALTASAQPIDAPDDAWRTPDQDNLLYITVAQKPGGGMESLLAEPKTGLVIVELHPDLAPQHAARMKELAAENFYEGRIFHRVIDDFMAQGGGLTNNPGGGLSGKPDLPAEFTARLGPEVTPVKVQDERMVNERKPAMGRAPAGVYHGAPVGYQPAAQAMVAADGKRDVWMLHCKGTASMARTNNPDSGNFQFYLMRGEAPWLDAQYTAWGRVVHGQDVVQNITAGKGDSDMPENPDTIQSMRVGSSLPGDQQVAVQVIRPESDAFKAYVEEQDVDNICDLTIPTRVKEDS